MSKTKKSRKQKYRPSECSDKMTFQECELAILRQAVDTNEKLAGQKIASSDEIKQMIGDDVKSVSEFHYNDMMQPRDNHYFELGVEYFDALDKSRGTNWRTTFPELSCYTN